MCELHVHDFVSAYVCGQLAVCQYVYLELCVHAPMLSRAQAGPEGWKEGPWSPLWCQAGTAEGDGTPAGLWTLGPCVRGGGRRAGRLRQP